MDTTHTNSPNVFDAQGKITKKSAQTIFYEFFLNRTTTVYEFERKTGISCANGCQYKRKLEKNGQLQVVRLGVCSISGANGVQFLTTDPKKFRPFQQTQIQLGREEYV